MEHGAAVVGVESADPSRQALEEFLHFEWFQDDVIETAGGEGDVAETGTRGRR